MLEIERKFQNENNNNTFHKRQHGDTLNEGCNFFEKNVKPLVTDDTKEIQFGLDADSISPSFLFGLFMNVIDTYIVEKEEDAIKISFDDSKVYSFFGTVAVALRASLEVAADIEDEQEQEHDFLS